MKTEIHPSILSIKNHIRRRKVHYGDIAQKMNCPEQHIKDIFSGRVELHGLWERDSLCEACEVAPLDIMLARTSEQMKHDLLPLKMLSPEWKQIIILMFEELTKQKRRRTTKKSAD